MKKGIKYSLVLLTVFLSMTGCSDSFLSPEPKSFFTPKNTLTSASGFKSALSTIRRNLSAVATGGRERNLMSYQWKSTEAGIPMAQLDFTKMQPSTDRYENFVGQINDLYRYIKNTNVVISRIDDIKWEDQNERNTILARALWYRAYWYYWLVGNYGDVPWIGKEIQGAKLDFNTYIRSSILHKLESDLEQAIPYLPASARPGEVTKAAGKMLLSKVYLANMKFDEAIKTTSSIINSGRYHLMMKRFGVDANDLKRNVIWDLHRPANKNSPENKETILAFVNRYAKQPSAREPSLRTMRTYHPAWYQSVMRDSEGNRGMIAQGAMYDTLGRGNPDCILTEWLQYGIWNYGGYTWKNTPDLRRADINWVDINEMRYNNPASANYGDRWQFEWMTGSKYEVFHLMYAMPIYKTMVLKDQENAPPYGGHGDWYIYRLAGTYLLRAEAYYWKGNLALAARDINKLRKRAHASLVSPGEVTIDLIFDERARELFLEAPRHNAMVRVSFIMAKKGIRGYSLETFSKDNWWYDRVIEYNFFYPQYTGDIEKSFLGLPVPIGNNMPHLGQVAHIAPHNILWPIDDDIIATNTLGQINQNVGYNGAVNNKPPKDSIPVVDYFK